MPRRLRGGRGGAPTVTEPAANASARQVTYSVNIEVDRKALRAQVFNEGWRIMKNRFYDPKMHGADWNAAKADTFLRYGQIKDASGHHNRNLTPRPGRLRREKRGRNDGIHAEEQRLC